MCKHLCALLNLILGIIIGTVLGIFLSDEKKRKLLGAIKSCCHKHHSTCGCRESKSMSDLYQDSDKQLI